MHEIDYGDAIVQMPASHTLTIVLTSQQPWDLVRPATSDAIEPFHIMQRKEDKVGE
jgi:hypothetical protein